jgi:hypothetical protein
MSDFELSAAEFRALYDRVKHMSRWGPDDSPRTSPAAASGLSFVMDRVAMNIHGNAVAPLRLRAATGSPVNPIAIF